MTARTRRGWTPSAGLVADARRALAAAPPDQAARAAEWAALLADRGAALLTRTAAPTHVTASGVVVTPDGRRTLLVLHGRAGFWVQPGGHLEPGDEDLPGAAAREVLEETGLVAVPDRAPLWLSAHRAPCDPGVVETHLDVQHLLVAQEHAPVVSEESADVRWWDVDALPQPLAPEVEESVARARVRVSRGPQSTSAPGGGAVDAAADQPSR